MPQGSALGPTLWNIVYDEVLDIEITQEAVNIGYADDLALIVAAPDEYILMRNVNICLERIQR